jgi:NAD(P)H-flavin reductase
METINKSSVTADVLDPMGVRPFRVKRTAKDTYDTFTLELEPADGGAPLGFAPGQFNMLYFFGVGEVPISVSGDPAKPKILVHTTRAVGAVTKAMSALKVGDTLGIRGPYGNTWPVAAIEGHDVAIIAGGIGLAPLRPAIYHILSNRDKYGKVSLLYGARTPEDILYRKELEHWRARFDLETMVTVDRAAMGWRGNVGVVTTLIGRASFDPAHTSAMICGPEIMMRFTALELQNRGVKMEDIYVSMERNMKCGVGLCGHCQIGSTFVCKDGPVYTFNQVREILLRREM